MVTSTDGLIEGISVVIPVYNSAAILPSLIEDLTQTLQNLGRSYEIILVNDGSRDESWQVILSLHDKFSNLIGIDFMRNFGQHNALLCGIRRARYSVIVTMDDDYQNPPREIPKLLQTLESCGLDVVYGIPTQEQHSLWRNLTSKTIKVFMRKAMRVPNALDFSAFRAINTEIRRAFADYKGTFVSIDVLLSWGTTRFGSVPVDHHKRLTGASNYTLRKLFAHAFTLITGFSILPLQLASMLGFASMIFGFVILLYVSIRYLASGGVVPGFTFLASFLAIFSGVQLFATGMIGEYLGRLFARSLDHPTYIVRGEVVEK